jgi:hypothetical protein
MIIRIVLFLNDNPMSLLQVEGAKDGFRTESLSKTLTWRAGVGMVLETPMLLMGFESKSNMDSGMFYGIQKEPLAT